MEKPLERGQVGYREPVIKTDLSHEVNYAAACQNLTDILINAEKFPSSAKISMMPSIPITMARLISVK